MGRKSPPPDRSHSRRCSINRRPEGGGGCLYRRGRGRLGEQLGRTAHQRAAEAFGGEAEARCALVPAWGSTRIPSRTSGDLPSVTFVKGQVKWNVRRWSNMICLPNSKPPACQSDPTSAQRDPPKPASPAEASRPSRSQPPQPPQPKPAAPANTRIFANPRGKNRGIDRGAQQVFPHAPARTCGAAWGTTPIFSPTRPLRNNPAAGVSPSAETCRESCRANAESRHPSVQCVKGQP